MEAGAKVLKIFLLAAVLLWPVLAPAQLTVSVLPVQVVGQKAVVQLKMKNDLADKVESARAVCFLLDAQGKVISQATKWVIGKSGLEPKGEATFNFVVSSQQGAQLAAANDAEALYIPSTTPGQPGTIVLGPNPSRTAVIEEVMHYGQDSRLGFPGYYSYSPADIARLEVEAQNRLLQQGLRSGWTQSEMSQIVSARTYWENRLKNLTP